MRIVKVYLIRYPSDSPVAVAFFFETSEDGTGQVYEVTCSPESKMVLAHRDIFAGAEDEFEQLRSDGTGKVYLGSIFDELFSGVWSSLNTVPLPEQEGRNMESVSEWAGIVINRLVTRCRLRVVEGLDLEKLLGEL
ncbi:hypothetical protein K4F52_002008 [Lecanicillium sp. MT-2017a]|nr:hypothetical protein K4F52_002008 [Lecanicillium sp. MT-2017a]